MYLELNTERIDMYKNPSRNSWNVLVSNVSGLLTVSKLAETLPFNCGISSYPQTMYISLIFVEEKWWGICMHRG